MGYRTCGQPGCPELVEGKRYCATHTPKRTTEYRSPESRRKQRAYKTQRWREFSKAYLSAHPTCVRCGAASKHTDHIDGLGLDGPHGWDEHNLQALCHSCHSHKTAVADGSFGRARLDR